MKSISVSRFARDSYRLNKQTLTVSTEKKKESTSPLLLSFAQDTPFPQAVPAPWHLLTFTFLCKWKETRIQSIWLPTCCLRFMPFQIKTSEISKIQVMNNASYLRISKGKFLYNRNSLAIEDSWKCIWGLDFLCQRTNLVLKMTLNSLLLS